MIEQKITTILEFWFQGMNDQGIMPLENQQKWWKKDSSRDQEIAERFEQDVLKAAAGHYDDWLTTAQGRLAYILLFDQFARQIYRNTPQSFVFDHLALYATEEGINLGMDQQLLPLQRVFFYLPLEHDEDIQKQNHCVELFDFLRHSVDQSQQEQFDNFYHYAIQHRNIIERFGRFPHRNEILARESSIEEIEFLKQPNSSF